MRYVAPHLCVGVGQRQEFQDERGFIFLSPHLDNLDVDLLCRRERAVVDLAGVDVLKC